ncbi:MAG: Eco57I restriction-modification methylase domain-containing protein, partial [Candidatus Scalinduaceae bacterium]
NNKFFTKPYFNKDINSALALVPYLNGGLFIPNKLDERIFVMDDKIFEYIFVFFNKYNFTIREELPLEIEVAVDPEMIGKVYESLVNISEETDERGEAGIFYAARTEIDLMCRRSLVEYFHNHIQIEKALIFEFIFSKTDEEKRKVDEKISPYKLWEKIEILLDNLTVVDPACGSGSFLVGMLNIISDLYRRTYAHLNREMSDFDIKKSIIGRSLYGVDVMDWAGHVAELRLWLQLIVETELKPEQLKIQPLLPNLSFKIRQGDSLVEEIGGVNLTIRTGLSDISASLKRRLTNLKNEKLKFYNNDPSRKFRSESMLLHEELNTFRDILYDKELNLSNRIKSRLKIIEAPKQIKLFQKKKEEQLSFFDHKESIKKEIEKLNEELENIRKARLTLKGIHDKPFVWDIDFAEIFSGDSHGFDIVIGNPPYVRQEKIAPPLITKEIITNDMKKAYKDKLEASIRAHFDKHLPQRLDKKSDLYIYFYFHGLALLNPKGTFCFITSNSWLDVGYGKNLQEFLLENVHIKAIYDNSAKRSFSQADVNTVIVAFSSPLKTRGSGLSNSARFILFKKPFEDVITAENLIEIENVKDTLNTDSYRVISTQQKKLLEEGWEFPDDISQEQKRAFKFNIGKYTGNKWGGKYLRAPDIYFTLLEKGKGKLVRLGDISEVRRGFTTGCNEFFYLPSKHFDIKKNGNYYDLIPKHEGLPKGLRIEEEYLKTVIKSPDEISTLLTSGSFYSKYLFYCHNVKMSEIRNNNVIQYIKCGEYLGANKRPSCKSRNLWYSTSMLIPKYIIRSGFKRIHSIPLNDGQYPIDKVLYGVMPYEDEDYFLGLYLNSFIFLLFIEIFGQLGLGQGLLFLTVESSSKLPVIDKRKVNYTSSNNYLNIIKMKKIYRIFEELNIDQKLQIRSQKPNPLPDRKALDDVVFDILGLTQAERDEVYLAVCELVKNRLEKARSV